MREKLHCYCVCLATTQVLVLALYLKCESISGSVKHIGVKIKVWAVLGSNALYMK